MGELSRESARGSDSSTSSEAPKSELPSKRTQFDMFTWHKRFGGDQEYAERICRCFHGPGCPHYKIRWLLLDILRGGWRRGE